MPGVARVPFMFLIPSPFLNAQDYTVRYRVSFLLLKKENELKLLKVT